MTRRVTRKKNPSPGQADEYQVSVCIRFSFIFVKEKEKETGRHFTMTMKSRKKNKKEEDDDNDEDTFLGMCYIHSPTKHRREHFVNYFGHNESKKRLVQLNNQAVRDHCAFSAHEHYGL